MRVAALGKKGSVSELLKTLGSMAPEERQVKGPAINGLKNRITDALAARKAELKDAAITARLAAEKLDVTLPVRQSPAERGRIHPISQVIDEIAAIFGDMGFAIAEGPDIETDHYNFTALNFPEGHPAREMHDTFFFQPDEDGERKLLRTHTSPVQIRTMETQKPPIRIVIPGKTYRQDSDATHSPMFHQVEGLVIDKTRQCRQHEVGAGRVLQGLLRGAAAQHALPPVASSPSPSRASRSTSSATARGRAKCASARATTGWRSSAAAWCTRTCCASAASIPDEYQGFAWGMGIDRIAMLKYGMPDLRAFFDADVRWLQHYGFRPLDMPTLFGGLSQ